MVNRLVLVGRESAGKSSLFRGLTELRTGDEANFKGSTVICRRCWVADCDCEVVDTPGIRDVITANMRLTLNEFRQADQILLVVRGTDLQEQLESLLRELPLHDKRMAIAVTFADKAHDEIINLLDVYREKLDLPIVLLNARDFEPAMRSSLITAIQQARLSKGEVISLPSAPVTSPQRSIFERSRVGPLMALLFVFAMYGVPVWLAYQFSSWLQPVVDSWMLGPLKSALHLPAWASHIFTGSYGLLTLGLYSFLWAFPVVVLIGLATALTEETGLHDRVSQALDPSLRKIGLDGRDLLPVLGGYGCNVVAVMQSRACSSCTRKACVSMISFGSACSYQIGATLAVFNSAKRPDLFIPYLVILFFAGAVHTRIWHGKRKAIASFRAAESAFLQWPKYSAVAWRIRAVVRQFILQAMPIFLLMCVTAALLDFMGCISWLSQAFAPLMKFFNLPGEVAPGLIMSILRKDGMLILNQDHGVFLLSLGILPLLLVVWIASTFSACLVTLWTIFRELGWRVASQLALRQAVTSLCAVSVIVIINHIFKSL